MNAEQDQTTWYKKHRNKFKILGSVIVVIVLLTLPLTASYIPPELYADVENLMKYLLNIFEV